MWPLQNLPSNSNREILPIQQIGRGTALLSAVVGSIFAGATGATSTNLAERNWRRAGAAPQVLANVPTQSAFPDTLFSLSVLPTEYFSDPDSPGFELVPTNKGEGVLPNWLNTGIKDIHLTGIYVTPSNPRGVTIIDNYAYVALNTDGLHIVDILNPKSPMLVGSYVPPGNCFEAHVEGGLAYLAYGGIGLVIVDVSDPSNPTLVGSYDTPGVAEGVHVVGNLAYIADGSSGLQIINVNNPNSPTLAGSLDTLGGSSPGRRVYVVDDFAYVADGNAGLVIVDVSNPSSPSLAGSYDTSLAKNVEVVGNFAYVADGSPGLVIVDVTNPNSPTLAGSYDTGSPIDDIKVVGNLLYANDGGDLTIFNVSNPYAATLVGTYDSPGGNDGIDLIGNFIYAGGSSLHILEKNLQLSGLAGPEHIGNHELELFAVDPDQNQASSTFILRVEGPPVATGTISNQLADVGVPFSHFIDQSVFPDPNGDVVYYSAEKSDQTALPSWLSFSPIGIFSGTPQALNTGTYDIQVEAYDGIVLARANSTFSLTVEHFPKLSAPLQNQAANIDAPYSYQVPAGTFTDQDIGDTLTYSTSSLPGWLNFTPGTRTFSGTPSAGDAGSSTISVTATDNPGATASTSFTLTVGEFPTLLNPISDQLAAVGTPYLFSIPGNTFTTPPGEFLSYRASKADNSLLPAWLGFVGPRLEFQGTPLPTDKGQVSLKVIAEDTKGGTAISSFDLNVVDALSQEIARIGGSFVYTIPNNMISSPLGPVTYTVTLGDGSPLPTWLSYNPATNVITGVPPTSSEGSYSILVTADDGVQAPVLGTLSLTVGTNAAPKVANPVSNQVAQVGQNFRLVVPDNTFVDANGDTLTLSAKRVNGRALPSWLTFSDRTLEGKPGPGDTGDFNDKTVPLQICATDGDQEACTVFDLSVQGTSNAETALTIFGPLAAVAGLAVGWYSKRGVVLNPWNRKNYDKGIKNLSIGASFNYKFEAPKEKIKLVKAYQEVQMLSGLPLPESWSERLKYNSPISGGAQLPSWLTYKEGERELLSISGPGSSDTGVYTIRAYGPGEVILEEVKLDVGGTSGKQVEMYGM